MLMPHRDLKEKRDVHDLSGSRNSQRIDFDDDDLDDHDHDHDDQSQFQNSNSKDK